MIEARDALVSLKVASYPHMKKEDASRLHRDLYKQAYPASRSKNVTTEDILKSLTRGR